MWLEPTPTVRLWIAMLCLAGDDDVVRSAVPALIRDAGITETEFGAAIDFLSRPDPLAMFMEDEGQRIKRLPEPDYGWLILHPHRFREKQSRAQYMAAQRAKRHRQRAQGSEL